MQINNISRVKSTVSYRNNVLSEHKNSFLKKKAEEEFSNESVNGQSDTETVEKSFQPRAYYSELQDKLIAQSEAADSDSIADVLNAEENWQKIIRDRMQEILDKIKKGENNVSYQIGVNSFTEDEWDRFLENFDSIEEVLRELMRERIKKMEEKTLEKKQEDRIRDEEYFKENYGRSYFNV